MGSVRGCVDSRPRVASAGGGALYDVGCYSVNLSRMLFGAEPERIQGSVTRDPDMGVDVLTSAILDFPNGVARVIGVCR